MKPHLSLATLASAAIVALVVVSVPWTGALLAQQQSPRGAGPPGRPGDLPAWIDLEREHRADRVVFRMEDGRDDSARDAVKRWVYEPRKENGVAVASPGRARLVFDDSTSN